MLHTTGSDSSSVTTQGVDWPQKWQWSVFGWKPCLESWACGYNQDLFIKIKMSWLTWTPLSASGVVFMGESLPWPVLHEQPESLYSFPKPWCSVSEHSPSPEQPGSWECLSKRDQFQPNKSPLKLENLPWALLGTPKLIPQLLTVVVTSPPTAGS